MAALSSPRFGGDGGKPYDDATTTIRPTIVGLKSLAIRHGTCIVSIQATYLQADGTEIAAPRHGGDDATLSTIEFADGEKIVKVSGTSTTDHPQTIPRLINSLEITTRTSSGTAKTYGPYGPKTAGPPDFTVVGCINGFFGRSGDQLDAIGFHMLNPLDPQAWKFEYTATGTFGGSGGNPFDDKIGYPGSSVPIVGIQSLTIQYGYSIGSLQTSFRLADGSVFRSPQHGRGEFVDSSSTIHFNRETGEQIVQVSGKVGTPSGPHSTGYVDMLTFVTLDSSGTERVYGPYGEGHSGSPDFVINGIVYGFFGRAGAMLDAVGFYI